MLNEKSEKKVDPHEKLLEKKARNYRKNHCESGKAARKKYYQNNKEKIKLLHRLWMEKNREKVNEYYKNRWHTDPEFRLKQQQSSKKYRQTHREKYATSRETSKTCKILRDHKESLKNDDDRLPTSFIIKQMEIYQKSRNKKQECGGGHEQ